MTKINLGKIMYTHRGSYNETTTYTNLDIVESGGSSYVRKGSDVVGDDPATSTSGEWVLHAERGSDGAWDNRATLTYS